MLQRDYRKNPIPYSFKVRNQKAKTGIIKSEDDLMRVITIALDVYRTNDTTIALRRIGKGICPKSFPISRQSYYFLELYDLTHGGEYGTELLHLPLTGGIMDQPSIFYQACSIISIARGRVMREKLDIADNNARKISEQANSGGGSPGPQKADSLSFK